MKALALLALAAAVACGPPPVDVPGAVEVGTGQAQFEPLARVTIFENQRMFRHAP